MQKLTTSALFTDFYELTMAQGFWLNNMNTPSVFDVFFRRNPFDGGFAVFAGIESFIDTLLEFHFSEDDIAYLDSLNRFDKGFLDYLRTFKFSGDVYAMEEGTIIFPNEPLVRIHASLIEAQIIEGLVLNQINFQSLIATKTIRMVMASKNSHIMEFGLRRAQGFDGAMSATRASFIGGASSTSNTLAGKLFGIPAIGTMAHSWIMSFPTELEAFEAYAKMYPESTTFLLDTHNTLKSGIKNAIIAGKKLTEQGYNFGVRLDSGDMQYLTTEVRKELDKAGLFDAKISVSNDLTEEIISTLVSQNAPIDSWGVGTNLVTGGKDSSFTGVYKLAARKSVENDTYIPTMKLSDNQSKTTNPGIKNVWRVYDEDGMFKADILALENEVIDCNSERIFYHPSTDYRQFKYTPSKVDCLLVKHIQNGARTRSRLPEYEQLQVSRNRLQEQLLCLDSSFTRILNPHIYKVSMTEALKDLKLSLIQREL